MSSSEASGASEPPGPQNTDAAVMRGHGVPTLRKRGRWNLIKRSVSRLADIGSHAQRSVSQSRLKHRDGTVWQRRFYEHEIHDARDFEQHVDYVHFNPVRHGHAASAAAWPFSTFHRYVREGIYAPDWGGTVQTARMQLE